MQEILSLVLSNKEIIDTIVVLCILGLPWIWCLEVLVKQNTCFEKTKVVAVAFFVLFFIFTLSSRTLDIVTTVYHRQDDLFLSTKYFLFLLIFLYLNCSFISIVGFIYLGIKCTILLVYSCLLKHSS